MPTISSSVIVRKKQGDLYNLLRSIEQYPSFLAQVENLKVISTTSDTALAEWRINVNGTPLRWKQLDIYDDVEGRIRFRMLEGDYEHYEGEWNLRPLDDKTQLSLVATIEWGLPHLSRYVDPFLQRRAELAIRGMLRAIKRRAEIGDGFRLYVPTQSESVRFCNRAGRSIIGFFDHLQSGYENDPFVVMPPGYGETKRDALIVSYYLVRNGFNVLRYDATDHVGESEGDIAVTTMSKFKLDLLSAIDFVESNYRVGRVGVIASSLAQRMALKAASEDPRIAFLLGVVGVVNLRETLKAIYREDIIGDVSGGRVKDTYDVLGFEIDKAYPITAIQGAYHDLESAIEDAKRLEIPLVFLVAEKDAWIKLDDVKVVLESSRRGEMHLIPEAMHQVFENTRAAKIALKQAVVSASKHLQNRHMTLSEVVEPNLRELAAQNQLEKERLRGLVRVTSESERHFWQEYLGSYQMLAKVPDYRDYIGLIQQLLGFPRRGQTVLDAGCGIGYYGAWFLSHTSADYEQGDSVRGGVRLPEGHYIGLDFVYSALRQAAVRHREIIESRTKSPAPGCAQPLVAVQPHYLQADLNLRIPLADHSVDKLCCSLVLSYLWDPLATLRELVRILKPGGRIVVTSLKPYADLSEIYRNFVSQAQNEQDIGEARKLLSSAGQIKQKEGEGHYQFFSERELTALMIATGLERVRVHRSFGNQANVAVAIKRSHRGKQRK